MKGEPRRRCMALMAEGFEDDGIPKRTRYCHLKPYHGTDHKDRWGFWWYQPTRITKAEQRHHDIWNGVVLMTPADRRRMGIKPETAEERAERLAERRRRKQKREAKRDRRGQGRGRARARESRERAPGNGSA